MNDARRFLRFLVPGALYGFETALLLSVLRPDWIDLALRAVGQTEGLLPVAGGLVASGVLGFLFGVIHQEIQSTFGGAIDHSGFVRGLVRNGTLVQVVTDEPVRELAVAEVTPQSALAIITAEWHQRADAAPIRGATIRVDSLFDIGHSSGAGLVASAISIVTAFSVAAFNSHVSSATWDVTRFFIACLISLSLVLLFWRTNRRVTALTQAVIEQTLLNALRNQQANQAAGQPAVVQISASGLLANTRLQPAAALRRLLQSVRWPGRRG